MPQVEMTESKENETRIELEGAIREYFEAMYRCDEELLMRVFHPSASLFDADDGRIFVDPINCYRDTIKRRKSPESTFAPREDEVLMIDMIPPSAAVVKVRVRIHENRFVDHLMFARDETSWRIVAKLWHLEEIVQ
ncbi:hypothetical protein P775_22715 [Puniceibacterium antarcticum]|uniref:DUF4440 domain-containing protein n=1 Tax=Puniceibacterium antarcticum TaxID=1206336 RepID=A0A2G8R8G3_9RHOB|nr:nuclear transport factor 2 family protein [Puniceibacterium antarcticum]PIL17844.1 hypothetical protein P775_22715 [Puniceibacterium antarcticum]